MQHSGVDLSPFLLIEMEVRKKAQIFQTGYDAPNFPIFDGATFANYMVSIGILYPN